MLALRGTELEAAEYFTTLSLAIVAGRYAGCHFRVSPGQAVAVAVVVSFRDRPPLLASTLESLAKQTLADHEVLLVDDGSSPASLAAARALATGDPRVRLLAAPADRPPGACRARNAGVRAARAPLVVFLDSDDQLVSTALAERAVAMAAAPELDFLVRDGEVFDHEPGDVGVPWNELTAGEPLHRFLAADTPWQTTGPTWRRGALERLGPWPEEATSWQDWEYHVRALCRGLRYGLAPVRDYHHRRAHPESMRARHDDLRPLAERAASFARVAAELHAGGAATPARCELLAGLCLRFALKCARLHRDRLAALDLLAPVGAAGLAGPAWQEAAATVVLDAAAGRNRGELDAAVVAAFPVLGHVCSSPGRERARTAPGGMAPPR